jgi:ABC-type nitrate/sulfonate/bicarbonate transport system substrate-binding protein
MAKNPKRRTLIEIICISLAVIIGVGYTFRTPLIEFARSKLQTPVTVELKWLHNAQFIGYYVADSKHWYEQNGLNVKFVERRLTGPTVLEDVASGKAEFGIVDSFQAIAAINKGAPIKVVAAIYQDSPAAIAVLSSSGIKTPQQLAGKRIGITSATPEAQQFSLHVLHNQHVDTSNITFVSVQSNQAQALLDGTVDAVSLYRTNDPYPLIQKEIGFTLFLPENYGLHYYDDVLITNDKMISEHPDIVSRFVKTTITGYDWALANPEEALALTQHIYHPTLKSIWRSRYVLDHSKELIKPQPDTNIGEMDASVWQSQINDMYETGMISKPLQADKVFTNRFIQ